MRARVRECLTDELFAEVALLSQNSPIVPTPPQQDSTLTAPMTSPPCITSKCPASPEAR